MQGVQRWHCYGTCIHKKARVASSVIWQTSNLKSTSLWRYSNWDDENSDVISTLGVSSERAPSCKTFCKKDTNWAYSNVNTWNTAGVWILWPSPTVCWIFIAFSAWFWVSHVTVQVHVSTCSTDCHSCSHLTTFWQHRCTVFSSFSICQKTADSEWQRRLSTLNISHKNHRHPVC